MDNTPIGFSDVDEARQIKSRERVANHGEVFTAEREVNAMLDLVKSETERIDATFLEPACGTGNFLIEIQRRKLRVVAQRYRRNQYEYDHRSALAVSAMYGVELMPDNVAECRQRLWDDYAATYRALFPAGPSPELERCIRYLYQKNIMQGDALSMRDASDEMLTFCEWAFVDEDHVKRADYKLSTLLSVSSDQGDIFFSDLGQPEKRLNSDKEYPIVHYLKLPDHDKHQL